MRKTCVQDVESMRTITGLFALWNYPHSFIPFSFTGLLPSSSQKPLSFTQPVSSFFTEVRSLLSTVSTALIVTITFYLKGLLITHGRIS